MTRIKRLLVLLGLTVSVVVGSTLPASAGFGDTAALSGMSVATATINAPGSVAGGLACGKSTSTMSVTWTASTSARISGYRVTVHYSDGYDQSVDLGPAATSWSTSTSTYNVTAYSIQYSVTTLTDYGWTKQSTRTGAARC